MAETADGAPGASDEIAPVNPSSVFAVTTATVDRRLVVVAAGLDGLVTAWDFSADPPVGRDFFRGLDVSGDESPEAAALAVRAGGDRMLSALVFHSADYELGEQFDWVTGYVQRVKNLTWSYAAFLSAARARARIGDIARPSS